jgi:AbrB family looped-hinge helix DNA binding protein
MIASKISSKGQVTIPKKVREALGVQPGDLVKYEIENGVVSLRRVEPFDVEFHAALSNTMEEWTSPEDEEAFRDL